MKIAKGTCNRVLTGAEENMPSALLLRPDFWWYQRGFLFIVGGAVLFVIAMLLFSFQDWSSVAPYAALFIYGGVLWGSYIAAHLLASLEVEHAIVCSVQKALDGYFQDNQRKDLERLEKDLLPDNSTDPPPLTLQMFMKVLEEAKDHRFDTSRGTVAPYREALANQLFDLRSVQTLGLRVGIMGTFLGLLYGLAQFSGMFGTNAQLDSSAKELIDALRIAFGTSVAGLVVSVVMALFIMLVRGRHKLLFRAMESVVVDMISAASNAINEGSFFGTELRALRHVVDKQQERLHELSREVEKASTKVGPWVQQQGDILQQGIDRLLEGKSSFDEYLEAQRQIIDRSAKLHGETANAFEKLLGQLRQANEDLVETTVHELKTQVATITDSLKGVLKQVDETNRVLYQHSTDRLAQTLEQVGESFRQHPARDAMKELGARLDRHDKNQRENTEKMLQALYSLRADLQGYQDGLEEFRAAVGSLPKVLDGRDERWVETIQSLLREGMNQHWGNLGKRLDQQAQATDRNMKLVADAVASLDKSFKYQADRVSDQVKNYNQTYASKNLGRLRFAVQMLVFIASVGWMTWLLRPELVDEWVSRVTSISSVIAQTSTTQR